MRIAWVIVGGLAIFAAVVLGHYFLTHGVSTQTTQTCRIGAPSLAGPSTTQSTRIELPLPEDAYVWQRAWGPAVAEAVEGENRFGTLVALAAEIKPSSGSWTRAFVSMDFPALAHRPKAGLAIRIGPLSKSVAERAFGADSAETRYVCSVVAEVMARAKKAGVTPGELQIDFDCADSRLAGYANWVRAIRRQISPVPLVITTLPSWLNQADFESLVQSADGFVLQVHSLHKPAGPDAPMTLCDADEAMAAVNRASHLGIPFRVALPTYSYLAGFTPEGKLLGLSAEGPLPVWPVGTMLREMRSDPAAMAKLVRTWAAHRPAHFAGIIWYRLPVEGDSMNWSPRTLAAVASGREPVTQLKADILHEANGPYDIALINAGDGEASVPPQVELDSHGVGVESAEGINGFEAIDSATGPVIFQQSQHFAGQRIAPGGSLKIGWIRLSQDTEVTAHVDEQTSP